MKTAVPHSGRQQGRSCMVELLKEAALDAGKKVLWVKGGTMMIQSRKKHLTLIVTLPRKES